jgi:hypothetical protein
LTLAASAEDEQGNTGTTSINVTVANDTEPPEVAFLSPANGATVKGTVTVSINATDNKALSRITLAIDGKIVNTVYTSNTSSTSNYSWNACPNRNKCSGNSTLVATAYDAANNSRSTTISVTKSK